LCNKREIRQGLDSKYSIYHSAAVGLVRGKAGLQEYTDAAANDPLIKRIRDRVTAIGDASITEDQSDIEVELENGQVLHRFIECSLGNVRRPLSDQQLEEKFRDQARVGEVNKLIDLCWRLDELQDLNEVVSATLS